MSFVPFPLLRLTYIPLEYVINSFDCPQELICLALCSKRCRQLVKRIASIDEKQFVLCLVVRNDYSIALKDKYENELSILTVNDKCNLKEHDTKDAVNINGHIVPSTYGKYEFLETYWDDIFVGLKTATDYVCDVLKCQLYNVTIKDNLPNSVHFIKGLQYPLKEIRLHWDSIIDEDEMTLFLQTLKTLRGLETLELCVETSENFRYSSDHFSNLKLHKLELNDSSEHAALSLEHFKLADCNTIHIFPMKFSNQDVNNFLKGWCDGIYSDQLDRISFELLDPFDITALTMGLQVFQCYYTNGGIIYVDHKIRRKNDGVLATIQTPISSEYLHQNFFRMYVKRNFLDSP